MPKNRPQSGGKSGDRVRVDARLIRAVTGYVVWSETYDLAFVDIRMVQDDIAGQKLSALRSCKTRDEKLKFARCANRQPSLA